MSVIVTAPAGLMTAPSKFCIGAENTPANLAPPADNLRTSPRSGCMGRDADLIRFE